MRLINTRFGLVMVSAVATAALVACGGGEAGGKSEGGASSAGGAASGKIDVVLSEWAIKPSAAKAKAGTVEFATTNKGATAHELAVYQTDAAPDKLAQAGGMADEKQVTVIGRTASLDANKSESKKVELKAGKYVLVCNLPAHYGQGMRAAFTVE
ncbi:MAG: plastocyanin/azurin family copper-binding protein [Dehalococcoidia bacterium]